MQVSFANRVALITGGARGIGFATAEKLIEGGARLVVADINEASAKLAAEKLGNGALGLGVDITDAAQVAGMVKTVETQFGGIDIFVNSAAVLDDKTFLQSTPADWHRMLNVCLHGPMLCLHEVVTRMVARKYGRVVCLASDAGRLGQARLSYYAAAKAGVTALVKSIAQEVGDSNVTLNIVSPGATNTPMRQEREAQTRAQIGEERYAKRVQNVLRMYPTKRLGEPEDIAAAVAFLVSDQASWITGQILSVNGGFVMP